MPVLRTRVFRMLVLQAARIVVLSPLVMQEIHSSGVPAVEARDAVRSFLGDQQVLDIVHLPSGHINSTFAVTVDSNGTRKRYVLQRVNTSVFREPRILMENIVRVTEHLRRRYARGFTQGRREVLSVVHTNEGRPFLVAEDGSFWRTYDFVEGAHTENSLGNEVQATMVGKAFGQFVSDISDLPKGALSVTIPDFHNTPRRLEALLRAAAEDRIGRTRECSAEIEELRSRLAIADLLPSLASEGKITMRNVHNDTKVNNVMLDNYTKEPVCVIDLDTVMPGYVLYDIGDLVRSAASRASEDEKDISQTGVDMDLFRGLVTGFLEGAGRILSPIEQSLVVHGAILITYEMAMRFLTDHLVGDVYFRIHRPGHNLDRARSQLGLLVDMERRRSRMDDIVMMAVQNRQSG